MIGAERHAGVHARGVHDLGGVGDHRLGRAGVHGVVVVAGAGEIHGDVLGLAAGGVNALCVAGIGGRRYASTDVGLAEVALEGGVGDVVIGGRVGGSGEVEGVGRGEGGVGGVAGVVEVGMERSAVEVFGGGWENGRCAEGVSALGRLGAGAGGVRGGGGDRVGARVEVGLGKKVEGDVGGHHLEVDGGHADK